MAADFSGCRMHVKASSLSTGEKKMLIKYFQNIFLFTLLDSSSYNPLALICSSKPLRRSSNDCYHQKEYHIDFQKEHGNL